MSGEKTVPIKNALKPGGKRSNANGSPQASRTKDGPKPKGFQSAIREEPLPKLQKRICNVQLEFHGSNNPLMLPCQPLPRQRRTLRSNDTLPYAALSYPTASSLPPVHAEPNRFPTEESIPFVPHLLDGSTPARASSETAYRPCSTESCLCTRTKRQVRHRTAWHGMAPAVLAKRTPVFRREGRGTWDHMPSGSPSP